MHRRRHVPKSDRIKHPLWAMAAIRALRSVPQVELARSTGFDQTYISRLENGTPPRSAADISKLAQALGVSDAVLTANAIIVTKRGKVTSSSS